MHDPDERALLKKLVSEDNEFVLAAFDVFKSDKD
jgi:hypothetical protein